MTPEEIAKYGGIEVSPSNPERVAAMEAAAKWRAEMEAKIKAMPEPERSKKWERWQNRLAKWND
jgi:hypothetical protein